MVSIYSVGPVYTLLYTIINGNVIAFFVRKVLRFRGPKKTFFADVRNLETPPSFTQSYALA